MAHQAASRTERRINNTYPTLILVRLVLMVGLRPTGRRGATTNNLCYPVPDWIRLGGRKMMTTLAFAHLLCLIAFLELAARAPDIGAPH